MFGPNGMRHFEQSLKAVANTGLPLARRMEVISQVDEYVLGYAEGAQNLAGLDVAEWEEEWGGYLAAVGEYLQGQLDSGAFPHIEEFVGGDDFSTVIRRIVADYAANERFSRGLERLLDGVEREIEREGGGT